MLAVQTVAPGLYWLPGQMTVNGLPIPTSLRRLDCEFVDLIQFHGTSYTPAEAEEVLKRGGLLDQLERLRDQGLVRFIGFTSEDQNPPVYQFIESGRFDVMIVTSFSFNRCQRWPNSYNECEQSFPMQDARVQDARVHEN
jgi:predicted aldo/keto reductase-like oxidoreductase